MLRWHRSSSACAPVDRCAWARGGRGGRGCGRVGAWGVGAGGNLAQGRVGEFAWNVADEELIAQLGGEEMDDVGVALELGVPGLLQSGVPDRAGDGGSGDKAQLLLRQHLDV